MGLGDGVDKMALDGMFYVSAWLVVVEGGVEEVCMHEIPLLIASWVLALRVYMGSVSGVAGIERAESWSE